MDVWNTFAADDRTLLEWFKDGEVDGALDRELDRPIRLDWVSCARRDLENGDAAVAYAKGYVLGWNNKDKQFKEHE